MVSIEYKENFDEINVLDLKLIFEGVLKSKIDEFNVSNFDIKEFVQKNFKPDDLEILKGLPFYFE